MIRTVLILFFLWSSLSIARLHIFLGEIPGRRENVLEPDLSANSYQKKPKLRKGRLDLFRLSKLHENLSGPAGT